MCFELGLTMKQISDHYDCLKLLVSLNDETDPLLVRLVDRARRADGLFPTCSALDEGPLATSGNARDLYITGSASDADFASAVEHCETLRANGNASQRELAALSLAILEASSIVHRKRLLISTSPREADARLAAAATGLTSEWEKLVQAAMHVPVQSVLARCA